ncbi:MAG: response regulator transcription factor [Lachnospiraceae bacterium]|nr:response regulator transcription factor [Lachnospiraceae bacterium]
MEKASILLIDDDEEIREVVSVLLSSEGYQVQTKSDGKSAISYLQEGGAADLIILDVMMPDIDGFEVCKRIREISNLPILFLTAKSSESDLLEGYRAGGDDYVQKPFSYTELVARVGALLRRYREYDIQNPQAAAEDKVTLGDLVIDRVNYSVTRKNELLDLTNTEYGILLLLAKNRGRVFSLQEIYEQVWEDVFLPTASNTVMVHIRNLREKLRREDGEDELIRNRWGKGYYID